MAEYDTMLYETELYEKSNDNISDLHAYYMTQFNLELELNKGRKGDNLNNENLEENIDFGFDDHWNNISKVTEKPLEELNILDNNIDSNINEECFKEVLLDLDNIEFDASNFKTESNSKNKEFNSVLLNTNTEYVDDESLLDELCREDGDADSQNALRDDYETSELQEPKILPSIETAFSKQYYNYNLMNNTKIENSEVIFNQSQSLNDQCFTSIDQYSYPNNVLNNIEGEKMYVLPDTPTSCAEFNFERNGRKASVCESIESDIQSSCYYEENSDLFDDDELFVNLEDFGYSIANENEVQTNIHSSKEVEHKKDRTPVEKTCLWEHCYEKYPNQSTLVEHIERAHVNTYKGDEFSCLWRECARCRRPFNARYKLLIHMRVHSGHKPNRCHHPGCGKAFSRLENLKIHVRSHTGERPYACPAPHCRKAFSNSSDRAKHQRTHFNARPYACGAAGCGKRYTDPSSLRKHVKSHPHMMQITRTCITPTRILRKPEEQTVPTLGRSPVKLSTLRCIRDKLTVPKLLKS